MSDFMESIRHLEITNFEPRGIRATICNGIAALILDTLKIDYKFFEGIDLKGPRCDAQSCKNNIGFTQKETQEYAALMGLYILSLGMNSYKNYNKWGTLCRVEDVKNDLQKMENRIKARAYALYAYALSVSNLQPDFLILKGRKEEAIAMYKRDLKNSVITQDLWYIDEQFGGRDLNMYNHWCKLYQLGMTEQEIDKLIEELKDLGLEIPANVYCGKWRSFEAEKCYYPMEYYSLDKLYAIKTLPMELFERIIPLVHNELIANILNKYKV